MTLHAGRPPSAFERVVDGPAPPGYPPADPTSRTLTSEGASGKSRATDPVAPRKRPRTEDAELNGVRRDGSDVPAYTGQAPAPFKQRLPMEATPPRHALLPAGPHRARRAAHQPAAAGRAVGAPRLVAARQRGGAHADPAQAAEAPGAPADRRRGVPAGGHGQHHALRWIRRQHPAAGRPRAAARLRRAGRAAGPVPADADLHPHRTPTAARWRSRAGTESRRTTTLTARCAWSRTVTATGPVSSTTRRRSSRRSGTAGRRPAARAARPVRWRRRAGGAPDGPGQDAAPAGARPALSAQSRGPGGGSLYRDPPRPGRRSARHPGSADLAVRAPPRASTPLAAFRGWRAPASTNAPPPPPPPADPPGFQGTETREGGRDDDEPAHDQ